MRPFSKTYTPADADADAIVDGGTGASLTLASSNAGDDLAHQLNFTSTANLSSITFTITGTDADGVIQTEDVTGPNNTTVESTKYFLTWISIVPSATLGANTVDIGWVDEFVCPSIPMNVYASKAMLRTLVNGTITYTMQHTLDRLDPAGDFNWTDLPDGTVDMTSITTGAVATLDPPPTAIRVKVESYSSGADVTVQTTHPSE